MEEMETQVRRARMADGTGHSGSRSGSFIADMQEESPCSTKICLYTNFFVTFSVLFSLQLDFSQRVTPSEGRPNLLSFALLEM